MKNDSHKKILEMLSDGKITVEEATALLSKLQDPDTMDGEVIETESGEVRKRAPRYLRVVVDSANGDKVNVRVPMSLLKTGIKLSALLPGNAAEKMSSHGFDLSQLSMLDGDELIEALSDLTVDVDSADGDKVRVFTE
jgi:polyhydroxyalkanoate synthesis regulator phasin